MAAALPLVFGLAGAWGAGAIATSLELTAGAIGFWTSVGYLGGVLIGSLFLGKSTGDKTTALKSEFNVPICTEGVAVPVIYGTNRIGGLIGTWRYFRAVVIEHDMGGGGSGGMLGGDELTSQEIRYYINFMQVLCMTSGGIDRLRSIDIQKKNIWSGDLNGPGPTTNLSTPNGTIQFYWGEGFTQQPSQFYAQQREYGTQIRHENMCYFTAGGTQGSSNGWLLGNSPYLQTLTTTLSHYPRVPAWPAFISDPVNDYDVNPVGIVLDILCNSTYGLKFPQDYIDHESFTIAAQIFADEKFGISFVMDSAQPLSQYIEDIKAWCNFTLYINRQGKLAITVFRENTVVDENSAIIVNDSSIIPGSLSVSYKTWADVPNVFQVDWTDPNNWYSARSAVLFNNANLTATQTRRQETVNISGITNNSDAARVGNRLLIQKGTPLATAQWQMNRSTTRPWVMSYVRLEPSSWPESAYLTMRITQIEESEQDRDIVKVYATEDPFAKWRPIGTAPGLDVDMTVDFGEPEPTPDDTDIDLTLYPFNCTTFFTLLPGDGLNLGTENRYLAVVGQDPNNAISGYNIYAIDNAFTEDDPIFMASRRICAPSGRLIIDLPNDAADEDALAVMYLEMDINRDVPSSVSDDMWQWGYQLVLVGNELISIRDYEPVESALFTNAYRCTGLRRGVFGTMKTNHRGYYRVSDTDEFITGHIHEHHHAILGDCSWFIRPILTQFFTNADLYTGMEIKYKIQPIDPYGTALPLDEIDMKYHIF